MGLKPCAEPGCPELVTGNYCPKHRKRQGGSRWLRLQRSKLKANPICEMCRHAYSVEVDHIVELQDGGNEFEWDNLQALCSDCHKKKSSERRRLR